MKRSIKRIGALLIGLIMLLSSVQAYATDKINTDQRVSLTVNYSHQKKLLANAKFKVYRVATVDAQANFMLTKEFAQSKIDCNSVESASQWDEIAKTLAHYVSGNEQVAPISPEKTVTNKQGKFVLSDLEQGLYLVVGEKLKDGDYTYQATPVMVCLPNLDSETDQWVYDVTISPKKTAEKNPTKKYTERRVQKVWAGDSKNLKKRPKDVTVYLYRDGELYDTVKLNEKNQWSAAWKKLPSRDAAGAAITWTLDEAVVTGYKKSIDEKGVTFVVTNTYKPDKDTPPTPPDPPHHVPQTGQLWWPVGVLLCLGLLSLIIGMERRRKHQ